MSDAMPIRGLLRTPYMVLGLAFAALSNGMMVLLPPGVPPVLTCAGLLFLNFSMAVRAGSAPLIGGKHV